MSKSIDLSELYKPHPSEGVMEKMTDMKLDLTNNGKPISFEEAVGLMSKVLVATFLDPDGAPALKEALRRLGYILRKPE